MRGFQNGLIFKFGRAVPVAFELECSKKQGFFRQDLEGSRLLSNITHLKWHIFLKGIFAIFSFCNFLQINTHNFVKKDPQFENKSLFDANFMELDMKKNSDPKTLTFLVWDLKTRAIWAQSLWQSGYKAISAEPWFQFLQTGLHFLKNNQSDLIKS